MTNENVSRIERSSKNFLFSIILYFIKAVLSFVSRTVFIWYLSKEYLGLNSLFSNILTLLSLAELGFGNAIIFSMYKPIADGDEEKVRQLLSLYKKFYQIIGCIILGVGLCVTPFLEFLIKDKPEVFVNLHIVYLIFLANTVASYFLSYRRALLVTNQRQDIESKIGTINIVALNLAQIAVLAIFQNYYIYILVTVASTVLENLVIYFVTNKMYPEYIKRPESTLSKEERKKITKNVFALFFHKLEYVFVCATDNIIISSMLGVSILGVYSNYAMIIAYIGTLVGFFLAAVRGSMGNYIATKQPQETETLMGKLNFAYMWLVGWCAICLICLFQPFINVWLGSEYLLSMSVVVALCVSFYFTQSRYMICLTKECAGIFWEDRYKALFTGITNIVLSIVLCYFFGLIGVVLGTIISTVGIPIWVEPKIVYKIYFKSKPKMYALKYLLYMFTTIIFGGITYVLCSLVPFVGLWGVVCKIGICCVVPNLLFVLVYGRTQGFKYIIDVAKRLLRKKTKSAE